MMDSTTGDFGARIDAHTIRFERDLPGPIERVWAYLTESEKRATWLYPGDIPREPGGEDRKTWPGEDGEVAGSIVIRTRVYDPPRVLEYEWVEKTGSEGPTRDSFVRFELHEHGELVHLTLTHGALDPASFASVGAGWHAHLDKFGAVLNGVEAPDLGVRYEELLPRYEALEAQR